MPPIVPFTAAEMEAEERRQALAHRRYRQFFTRKGCLIGRYQAIGDELIEFSEIVSGHVNRPDLSPLSGQQIIGLFVDHAVRGNFPKPGTGLWSYRDRDVVRALIDLFDFGKPAAGKYLFRPGPWIVRERPLTLWSRRSTWVLWHQEYKLTVLPQWQHGFVIEGELTEQGPPQIEAPRPERQRRPADDTATADMKIWLNSGSEDTSRPDSKLADIWLALNPGRCTKRHAERVVSEWRKEPADPDDVA